MDCSASHKVVISYRIINRNREIDRKIKKKLLQKLFRKCAYIIPEFSQTFYSTGSRFGHEKVKYRFKIKQFQTENLKKVNKCQFKAFDNKQFVNEKCLKL